MNIVVPNLGEGAESGTVVSVLVKVGDKVTKDQTLIELENEKAVAPIPSPGSGMVTKVFVKVGDKVTIGQSIVTLSESGAVSARPEEKKALPRAPEAPLGAAYQYESKSGFPPPASPALRKMAKELGVDLTHVRGSESGGRITGEDVRAYVTRLQGQGGRPAKAPAENIDFAKWGAVEKKAVSPLRGKIAEKMTESWTTIPHVTQFDEADITKITDLRKKYAPAYEKKGVKLTLTSFLLKAVVPVLKKYSICNSSLDESSNEIVLKKYYHIGIAVDTEQGLIVPVLRDVDKKSVFEVSKELQVLAEKTRQRKVSIDELKGGSFTISNLGGIGGTFFTPIVNKPEVAILGVGRGVAKGPKLMLPLALSYDHRVVDGADGARFIVGLVQALENFDEKELKL